MIFLEWVNLLLQGTPDVALSGGCAAWYCEKRNARSRRGEERAPLRVGGRLEGKASIEEGTTRRGRLLGIPSRTKREKGEAFSFFNGMAMLSIRVRSKGGKGLHRERGRFHRPSPEKGKRGCRRDRPHESIKDTTI